MLCISKLRPPVVLDCPRINRDPLTSTVCRLSIPFTLSRRSNVFWWMKRTISLTKTGASSHAPSTPFIFVSRGRCATVPSQRRWTSGYCGSGGWPEGDIAARKGEPFRLWNDLRGGATLLAWRNQTAKNEAKRVEHRGTDIYGDGLHPPEYRILVQWPKNGRVVRLGTSVNYCAPLDVLLSLVGNGAQHVMDSAQWVDFSVFSGLRTVWWWAYHLNIACSVVPYIMMNMGL